MAKDGRYKGGGQYILTAMAMNVLHDLYRSKATKEIFFFKKKKEKKKKLSLYFYTFGVEYKCQEMSKLVV